MRVTSINYSTPLSLIEDINNANIDVFVSTDEGFDFNISVTTPNNYYWYMEKEGLNYIPASPPDIIVKSLTTENIQQAVESFLEDDGYWIKVYCLSWKRKGAFDIEQMNQLLNEIKQNNKSILE
ncbi:hypothetical protein [Paenibacillus sp. SYP-B4298]|uniref:hypothetical protein n=1 Tax=Paenibacillus sp. SYP-B4298 TaxID=2996034 RepID=UPI0022DE939E|nr:hypothetical protein [Paenibacillus sp. SYP-B4298]